MIGADTNVLLRHLVKDDPQQAPLAARFFAEHGPHDPVYVSTAVVLELIWTLTRSYRVSRAEVSHIVQTLTRSREVVLQHQAMIRRAVWDADTENTDIADAIIAHTAIDAGCAGVVTFDRRAQRLPGMLQLD